MKKLLLAMFIGASFYFIFPAVAIAEEHEDINVERALYLDAEEMDRIISGKGLDPTKSKKIRDWEKEEYLIKF